VIAASSQLRRDAARLLDQQLWCFGRDIRDPSGNILVELGFCRYRCPLGEHSSLYTTAIPGGWDVWLWGFGVAISQPSGSLFLRRYQFRPQWTAAPGFNGIHEPERLPRLARPTTATERQQTLARATALCRWFADYEHWILEHRGAAYRMATLAQREKAAFCDAGQQPGAWERLAKKMPRCLGQSEAPRTPWAAFGRTLRAAPKERGYRPPGRVTSGARR
jgi:hypothetical protein